MFDTLAFAATIGLFMGTVIVSTALVLVTAATLWARLIDLARRTKC